MRKFTLRISIVWLVVAPFVVIECALFLFFLHVGHEAHEEIIFGASIVAGAFALFSYVKGIDERRTQAADRIIERWNNPDLSQIKRCVREICEGLFDPTRVARDAKGTPLAEDALKLRADVVAILNIFEEISLLIRANSANEEKLRRYFRPVMIQAYKNLRPWIENERKLDNEDAYYCEFEAVVLKWKEV
jgi:Domain of unknown function (DUF4760)